MTYLMELTFTRRLWLISRGYGEKTKEKEAKEKKRRERDSDEGGRKEVKSYR